MAPSRGIRLLVLLALPLGACTVLPPPITQPPSGRGWTANNQAYNVTSTSTSVHSSGRMTVTTRTSRSANLVLFGSPLQSDETPRCKGRAWLTDCDFTPKD